MLSIPNMRIVEGQQPRCPLCGLATTNNDRVLWPVWACEHCQVLWGESGVKGRATHVSLGSVSRNLDDGVHARCGRVVEPIRDIASAVEAYCGTCGVSWDGGAAFGAIVDPDRFVKSAVVNRNTWEHVTLYGERSHNVRALSALLYLYSENQDMRTALNDAYRILTINELDSQNTLYTGYHIQYGITVRRILSYCANLNTLTDQQLQELIRGFNGVSGVIGLDLLPAMNLTNVQVAAIEGARTSAAFR